MLFKSTQQSRDVWCRFAIKLQPFDVTVGGKVISKREAFDRLYNEDDISQVLLLMSNIHSEMLLVDRDAYREIALRQQHLEEVTQEVLTELAVEILRKVGTPETFEQVVGAMSEAMGSVLENHREIGATIKERIG
jgi:hypothetical protein